LGGPSQPFSMSSLWWTRKASVSDVFAPRKTVRFRQIPLNLRLCCSFSFSEWGGSFIGPSPAHFFFPLRCFPMLHRVLTFPLGPLHSCKNHPVAADSPTPPFFFCMFSLNIFLPPLTPGDPIPNLSLFASLALSLPTFPTHPLRGRFPFPTGESYPPFFFFG